MRKLVAALLIMASHHYYAQTNVSGGIFQNTTWTLAGSPYIVTGSIVVFPGKTLTIEPGCEVRFTADYSFNTGNFQYLEIRGSLVAIGTDANRIKFTSSDTTDGFSNWLGINIKGSQGGNFQIDRIELLNSWYGIYNDIAEPGVSYSFTNSRFKNNNYAIQLNADMNYTNCLFEKNAVGQAAQIVYGSLTATNCVFNQNFCSFTWSNNINVNNCIFSGNTNNIVGSPGTIQNSFFYDNAFAIAESSSKQINNCVFDGNEVGIDDYGASTITNSQFLNNLVAIKMGDGTTVSANIIENNSVGVQVRGNNPSGAQIVDNQLCYNASYNLENLTDKNFQVNANCFCSSDSTVIENSIYDGYDDITRGLVNYAIYDDSCATILSFVTKVALNETNGLNELTQEFNVWNTNQELYVVTENDGYMHLLNAHGQIILEHQLTAGKSIIPFDLAPGIYLVRDDFGNQKRLMVFE